MRIEKDKIKTLIADISHQTKTPIANLFVLYSELIAEQDLSEEMRSNIHIIQQQTEKLRFLIDSLVKLSRLENGILTLSPQAASSWAYAGRDSATVPVQSPKRKGLQLQLIDTEDRATFDRKWTAEALGESLSRTRSNIHLAAALPLKAMEYELFTSHRCDGYRNWY